MDDVYRALGVPTIINAAGTLTRLGGCRMPPEVVAAMAAAAQANVRLDQLHAAASRRLAPLCQTQAALVTAGAAAGLTLAAAACIAGLDPARMDRLPDTAGMPAEIIIPRSHRNGYDHALRAAGARLVEVGLAERTRDPQPWEIDAAIGPQTVAVAFADGFSPLALADVIGVARRRGIPVIVDAAASLPPRANLHRFCRAGADLVVFSGGKAIGGPQASGILCGRRDLVASAALQSWDLDFLPALWDPPPSLIDPDVVARGVPNHGLGRAMKVGKEEIVGLVAAVERFAAQDEAAENAAISARARRIVHALTDRRGLAARLVAAPGRWDSVRLTVDQASLGVDAIELARRLERGDPPIYVGSMRAAESMLEIDPLLLDDEQTEQVVKALSVA